MSPEIVQWIPRMLLHGVVVMTIADKYSQDIPGDEDCLCPEEHAAHIDNIHFKDVLYQFQCVLLFQSM